MKSVYSFQGDVSSSAGTLGVSSGTITTSTIYSPSGVPFKPTVTDAGVGAYTFNGLAYDLFDRADSATTLTSAVVGGAWTAVSGTWGTLTNEGYCVSDVDGQLAVLPTVGTGDHTVTCAMKGNVATGSNYRRPNLVFRYVDSTNFLYATFLAGSLLLKDNATGSSIATSSMTTADNTYYVIKVVCKGSSIKVYADGVLKIDYTMTGAEFTKYGTAGITGIRFSKGGAPSVACRFNNLIVEAS